MFPFPTLWCRSGWRWMGGGPCCARGSRCGPWCPPARHGVSNWVSPPLDGGGQDSVARWGRALAVRGGEWGAVVSGNMVVRGVPKAPLPKGKGQDVYPRVQVNGLGCVCCVRAVCKCVVAKPDPCTLALGRHCLADACAQSHRVSFAHCTLRAALHHQCLLCGAALLGALHYTALCVPCCTVVVGRGQWAV